MRTVTRHALVLAALCLGASAGVDAGRYAFAMPWYLPRPDGTALRADTVAVGDFDGDGRDDVAFMAWGGVATNSQVSVSLQLADGTMGPVAALVAPHAQKFHLHAADVDGDGAAELLVGHADGLLVHDLSGGAWTVETIPAPSSCTYLASADTNGDGAVDVLCQGAYGTASLFEGQAGVGLGTARSLEIPGFGGRQTQIVLGDATGDARPDLVVAAWGQNAVYVMPNDGAGGFEPAVVYPLPGDNVVGTPTVAVVDLDADGENELVAVQKSNVPESFVFVWRRGANGFMRFDTSLQALDMPSALIAEDMDGDGHPELIVTHSGFDSLSHYIGTAEGPRPTPLFSHARTEHGTQSLAVGDLDSDGQRDVVVATDSFGVAVLYGGREQPIDLDGDLVSDLLWRHASGQYAAWAAADHRLPIPMPRLGQDWTPAASGQFDAWQGTELVFRHGQTGANASWGMGWGETVPLGRFGNAWRVAGVGDFDGDGESDLLWRNASTGANQVWSSADPESTQSVRRLADLRWSVGGVGDFDGDGQADILWRHAASGANVLWRSAKREYQVALPGTGPQWMVAGIGDFDRDGEDDVLWRNGQTGSNAIWRSADPATPWPVRGVTDVRWLVAAVGDYDGDGYSDVLWWHSATGRNAIWLRADQRRQKALRDLADTRWRVAH